jgi:hypothetical protein
MEGEIRKKVNVRSRGIGIANIKRIQGDKLLVNCASEEDRNAMRSEITKATKLLTVEPKRRNPFIVFRGVVKGITNEDLNESLRSQNRRLGLKEVITMKMKRRNRNSLLADIVCQVTAESWRVLTNAGKVHIGYQGVRVEDFSPVIQCFGCFGYGHTMKFCNLAKKCFHCGGEHAVIACPDKKEDKPPTCINCSGRKESACHASTSKNCPIWQATDRRVRDFTDYGEMC